MTGIVIRRESNKNAGPQSGSGYFQSRKGKPPDAPIDQQLAISHNEQVSFRRLFAAAVAILLLLPAATALVIAGHLALEHAAGHDPAAEHGAALAIAEHGHFHAAGDPAHEHSAAGGQDDAASRRAAAPLPLATGPGAAGAFDLAALAAAGRITPQGAARLPAICGPPLLALLSILRI
jgi:hypothetical protein